jgi:pyridoxine kinase
MICAGSSITASGKSRPFFIEIPIIEGHYRGTGDMFSALTLARFREQVSLVPGLLEVKSWVSPDVVTPTELPLAKAIEKVLVSMNLLLERTRTVRSERLGALTEEQRGSRIEQMKAGELRLVQGVNDILRPEDAEGFVVFESQLLEA